MILAIDTSCDETAAAIVQGRRVLSSVVFSQIHEHQQWGGVVPSVAKRAHTQRIEPVIEQALRKAHVSYRDLKAVAVTIGPGLAIALEVGIKTAQRICMEQRLPLIAVNHMEGHLFSPFVQNSRGNPVREFPFPMIAVLVSGGHSEFVLWTDTMKYEVIGRTVDDAAGEALDKAAKILGFGYPGGPIIERLAAEVGNRDLYQFPRPMLRSPSFDMSFSGLKTSLLYQVRSMTEDQKNTKLHDLASSFQEAVFDTILRKLTRAIRKTKVQTLTLGGGVGVNARLRALLRRYARANDINLYTPPFKYLNFDNAAMIGIVGSYKLDAHQYVADIASLDRIPRLSLPAFQTIAEQSRFMKKRVLMKS